MMDTTANIRAMKLRFGGDVGRIGLSIHYKWRTWGTSGSFGGYKTVKFRTNVQAKNPLDSFEIFEDLSLCRVFNGSILDF